MRKRFLTFLLCIGLMSIFLPQTVQAADDYTYIDQNGETKTTEGLTVTPITADTATLSSGWYVVNSDVTRNGTITVSGSANLILADGYTLSVTGSSSKAGIGVSNGNSLTIYGQGAGTGTLNANGGQYGAGIGGTYWELGGTTNINGGTILATGGQYGAGIGGGHNANAGTTTISGGTVTATGGENSAGIGGGNSNVSNVEYGIGGTINITGGNITANGNGYGAGIGGGLHGQSGTISISGGVINATSGDLSVASGGAGIGGGAGRGVIKITISGGTVIATALDYGAGIGGGSGGGGGIIEISGGNVTASSRYRGAGIGGGNMAGGGTTTISGGTVDATSGYGGAGIGGGYLAAGGTINIQGGDITARGGSWGAGIGSAGNYNAGNITISGGVVKAFAGDYNTGAYSGSAGIGAGGNLEASGPSTHNGGTIKILGGNVTAAGAYNSLDIGRGRNGINGTVLIDEEAIVTLAGQGVEPSVTTFGTCIIKGAGAGAQTGAYEGGIRLATTVIDLEASTLSGGTGYTVSGNTVTLSGSGNAYALVGGTTSRNVAVTSGSSADVILFAADIAPDSGCAFNMSGATVNMRLISDNTLSSNAGFAGIQAPYGSVLSINGPGSLTAAGGSNGAGIGGGSGMAGGSISITGGTVEAVGSGGGAGVGGGNGSDGGTVLADGEHTTLTATGGANGFDIGSGNSQISGGSLTIQNHATVIMTHSGTNALKNYITGTVGGAGSQLDAGEYLDSHKLLTCTGFTASPSSGAKAYDLVQLTVNVTGLSSDNAQGKIVFYSNGSEIGQASLNRVADGSADAMAVRRNWVALGGTHTLTAEYVQDPGWDSYYMAGAGSLTYEVARIDQAELSLYGLPSTVTYGDAFNLSASGGSGSGSLTYAVTSGDAVTVNAATGAVTAAKAGMATVTVTKAADNNYNPKSASVNITVNKATPPLLNFPSAGSITYGHPLSDSVLTGGTGDGTFAWESSGTVPPVNNSGYTVVFTPNDTDNYDYTGVTLSKTVNITVSKAMPAVAFPTAGELMYGQPLSDSALTGGSGNGSFAWESSDTIPTVVNSGYNVIFTPNDTDNYNTATQAVAISVLKAEQATLSIAEPSVTYGDAPFGLSVSGGSGTGSLSYAVTSGDAVTVNTATGVVTVVKAGSAAVKVTKAADSNYNAKYASVTVTVDKAAPIAVFPAAAPLTYGQALSDSLLTGGSGDGSFAWENPHAIPTVNNSGYNVIFTPNDTDNYLTIERLLALVVSKASQAPLVVSGIPDTLTFGDAPYRINVDGGSGTGALSYAVVSGDAVAVDAAGMVTTANAGTAAIKVTNLGDSNYLPVSHTFSLTVNKAAQKAALAFALPESIAYGDAPFQIFGSGGSGGGAFSYFVASGDAVTISETGLVTVIKPGDAVITAVKAGDGNYLSQTKEIRLSVDKGKQNALIISGVPARVVAGQAPFSLTVNGGSGMGALVYTVTSGKGVIVDGNGTVTILKSGKALLTVTKEADEYYLATTATAEIYVRKAAYMMGDTPTASPSPSAAPTATAAPSPTATAAPSPAATVSASPTGPAVILKPLSIHTDEQAGAVIVTISLQDLPDGTAAFRLPSGDIIQIDPEQSAYTLSVSQEDINEYGELVIVALNEESIPLGNYQVDLSDHVVQSGSAGSGAGILSVLFWIAAGALAIGVASVVIVSQLKKKQARIR